MKLQDYYLLEHPDSRDILILNTKEPYLIGKVWLFTSDDDFTSFKAQSNAAYVIPIPGYMIAITSYTSLQQGTENNVESAYMHMANFYYEQRIKKNSARYKRHQSA